jgi:hypothetical protein
VPVPAPFSIETFAAGLASWYGSPLILREAPLRGRRPAMWVCTADCDAIVYDRDLPFAAQLRAIAHQLAHMLFNHRGDVDAAAGLPVPIPGPAATCCSGSFPESEEREAEEFAGYVLDRVAWAAFGDPSPTR